MSDLYRITVPLFTIRDHTTSSTTSFEPIISFVLPQNLIGVRYFSISIDPNPDSLFNINIGSFLTAKNVRIFSIWNLQLPELETTYYAGFVPNDVITVEHKSLTGDPVINVVTLALVYDTTATTTPSYRPPYPMR